MRHLRRASRPPQDRPSALTFLPNSSPSTHILFFGVFLPFSSTHLLCRPSPQKYFYLIYFLVSLHFFSVLFSFLSLPSCSLFGFRHWLPSWGPVERGRRCSLCTMCIDHSKWLEKICLIGFQISLWKKTTPKKELPLIIVCGRESSSSQIRREEWHENRDTTI